MVISIDREEIVTESNTYSSPNNLGTEGKFLNLMKSIYETCMADIIMYIGRRLNIFPLRLGKS